MAKIIPSPGEGAKEWALPTLILGASISTVFPRGKPAAGRRGLYDVGRFDPTIILRLYLTGISQDVGRAEYTKILIVLSLII